MKAIGILLLINGAAGIALSSIMFGDIGIAAMVGALSSLLSGIGFLLPERETVELISIPVEETVKKGRKLKYGIIISAACILLLFVIGFFLIGADDKEVSHDEFLTKEQFEQLYTNAKPFKGYQVDFYGRAFLTPDKNDKYISFQVYANNDTNKNTIIRLDNTNTDIKDGEILHIVGRVHDMFKVKNIFGAELKVPAIVAEKVTKSDYATAFAPAIKIIDVNQIQNWNGYVLTVSKVELAKQETRVYLSVSNESEASMSFLSSTSKLIQGNKQFNQVRDSEKGYTDITGDYFSPGVLTEGIVVFDPIDPDGDNFNVIFEGVGGNLGKNTEPFIFEVPLKHEIVKPINPFPESLYEGKIDGIPLALGDDADTIVELMGEPETIDVWEGSYYFKYPAIVFFTNQVVGDYGNIATMGFPVGTSIAGVTIGQSFSEIQKILGETEPPGENNLEGGWTISYQIGDYSLTFDALDKNGPTTKAIFSGLNASESHSSIITGDHYYNDPINPLNDISVSLTGNIAQGTININTIRDKIASIDFNGQIIDGYVNASFEDDGWGESGTIHLELNEDSATLIIYVNENDESSGWGVSNSTYLFESK